MGFALAGEDTVFQLVGNASGLTEHPQNLLKRAYDRSLIVRHDRARQREGDAVIPPILPRMEARRHARPALERRNNRARPDVFNGRRSPLV